MQEFRLSRKSEDEVCKLKHMNVSRSVAECGHSDFLSHGMKSGLSVEPKGEAWSLTVEGNESERSRERSGFPAEDAGTEV